MRFHVGTRKGLFTFEKRGAAWEIDRIDFLGDPVTMLLPDRRDGALYAALTLGHFGAKLRKTVDEGKTWQELGLPVFPEGAVVPPHPMGSPTAKEQPASLSEIWSLESGGADHPERLWAGAIPAAVFVSEDLGQSWQINESLWEQPARAQWFGGGKDLPGVHSICVDPRSSERLSVGISCGGVWQTRDGGREWQCRSDGMRAAYMPPDQQFEPTVQDPHRLAQSPSAPDHFWVQHHNGIFHSDNDCAQWKELEMPLSTFGFAVVAHPLDPQTAWFVPGVKDECRVAVDGRLAVTRTRDGGRTFEELRAGLPQEHCYDIVLRHALAVDDRGETLVFGSTCGNLWVSENGGESWENLSMTLPMIYTIRFA